MTIYGLSCCLGGSLKQRILGYWGQRDHRDDLILSHFFQIGKLRPTAIIISMGVIPFSTENRQIVETSVIHT